MGGGEGGRGGGVRSQNLELSDFFFSFYFLVETT